MYEELAAFPVKIQLLTLPLLPFHAIAPPAEAVQSVKFEFDIYFLTNPWFNKVLSVADIEIFEFVVNIPALYSSLYFAA